MPDAMILIVEDEAIVAEDLTKKLQHLGYAIAGTTGLGEEAINLTRDRRPSLVLMDINLAGAMDGIEAAERIRREYDAPVVFLSALTDRGTLDRAKLAEPFGFILKPFEDRDLESHIEMALYRHRAERKIRESEARYRSLFEHMFEGFAYCQMLYDPQGRPDDFIYLTVNDAFGRLTGLADVVGQRVTHVIPRIKELNPEVFEIYGRVARTGTAEQFEIDFKPLQRYLFISVYSPAKGYFVAVFDDITERKQAENKLTAQNRELEYFNRMMVGRELRMVELKKEIDLLCQQLGQPSRYGYETTPTSVQQPPSTGS
jgi:PAS domain S-box-containing protein